MSKHFYKWLVPFREIMAGTEHGGIAPVVFDAVLACWAIYVCSLFIKGTFDVWKE